MDFTAHGIMEYLSELGLCMIDRNFTGGEGAGSEKQVTLKKMYKFYGILYCLLSPVPLFYIILGITVTAISL